MNVQTQQLHGVRPQTLVKGFVVEILKYKKPIVADTMNETLVIDYYYLVTVICTGENKAFSVPGYFDVAISQLTDTAEIEFVADYPVVMLQRDEKLGSITVQHIDFSVSKDVWLLIEICKCSDEVVNTLGFLIRTA